MFFHFKEYKFKHFFGEVRTYLEKKNELPISILTETFRGERQHGVQQTYFSI